MMRNQVGASIETFSRCIKLGINISYIGTGGSEILPEQVKKVSALSNTITTSTYVHYGHASCQC